MGRANTRIDRPARSRLVICALLLAPIGCGGGLVETFGASEVLASHNTALGDDMLAQAPPEMLEQDLPGCDTQQLADQAVLLRHPAARDLVVVVQDGAPVCVDTMDVALVHLDQASTQRRMRAVPNSPQDDDPVPVTPPPARALVGEPRPLDDDPVPVQPLSTATPAGAGTAPVNDDPVPVQPGPGSESLQSGPPAPGGHQPADDDPVPVRTDSAGISGPEPTGSSTASGPHDRDGFDDANKLVPTAEPGVKHLQ